MAITEALGCGTPVVISEACHFPEVAESQAGLVVPLDAACIADALDRVLCDVQMRKKMGHAGRELVLSRFTWPKIAQKTIAAYEKVLDSG